MSKIITAEEAVKLIEDNQTVIVSGFGATSNPEELLWALEKRFLETGSPKNLSAVHGAGIGDKADSGMNHFAHEGMIKKVYCGHIGLAPKLGQLVADNKCECYMIPQGVVINIVQATAAQKPGVLTNVGLRTFVDPRVEGCRANPISNEVVVKLMEIDGKEHLYFPTRPLHVALIRGTTADERGNISFEQEAVFLDQLSIAQAVKASGGIVIAQVGRLAKNGNLSAQRVKLPGIFVDYVVVAKPEHHWQNTTVQYNPSWSGEIQIPMDSLPSMDLDVRKIIARRAAMELFSGATVNLGVGVPEGVANVAAEEGISDQIILTVEAGTIGGVPASGLGIGCAFNPDAIIDQAFQFDYYDGYGVDLCYLGLAETDQFGNLNVSKFSGKVVGPGGFINISQNAKKVMYCGTFTAGKFQAEIKDGKLNILQEGKNVKFIKNVEQITFSGQYAAEVKQPVLYITERAVFKLSAEGLVLIEIAPGVDLEKDILAFMEFKPVIATDLKLMDERIFRNEPMKLIL
ncbi:MAG: carA 3 [Firmicutes bacterium]|nr:carA 3 [Bacillota bacterium]